MARYTPNDLTGALAPINAELEKIKLAVDDSMSRKGDNPNAMEASLDMNSNRLYNLATPVSAKEPVTLDLFRSALTDDAGSGALRVDLSLSESDVLVGGVEAGVIGKSSVTNYISSGINVSPSEMIDHKCGVLSYLKTSSGKVNLIDNLKRFYPDGAFLKQQEKPINGVAFRSGTDFTLHGSVSDLYIVSPSITLAVTNQNAIAYGLDKSDGRVYSNTNAAAASMPDYSCRWNINSGGGSVQLRVKQPTGVALPSTFDFYVALDPGFTAGDQLFVDPVNGLDTNSGTSWAFAKKTMLACRDLDSPVVWVKSGLYLQGEHFATITTAGEKAWIAVDGDVISITNTTLSGVWTDSGSGAWSLNTGSDTASNCCALDFFDKYGSPVMLKKVNSLAEVQATNGSFYGISGTVYVKMPDGSEPVLGRVIPTRSNVMGYQATTGKHYHKGFIFIGGNGGAFRARSGDSDTVVIGEDSRYVGCHNGNGVEINNSGLCIFKDSIAGQNFNDGFNYKSVLGTDGRLSFVEVNCVGYDNRETGTGNGSTAHDTVIGYRVNCHYAENLGAQIGDIDNSITVNLGISSTLASGNALADGARLTGNSKVWFDGYRAFGNQGADIRATTNAQIKVRDVLTEKPIAIEDSASLGFW